MKLNIEHVREDVRKLAIALMLGGGLGFFTNSIGSPEALIISLVGGIMWVSALLTKESKNV